MINLEEILEGSKKGDRQSQEKLYRQFYPALYALCKTYFSDPHDIVTAINNGMLKVYKNIELYNDQKGIVFNWIYSIVRNEALTLLRNQNTPEVFYEIEPSQESANNNPFENSNWTEVYEALSSLPNTTRAICTLFYIEDFKIKEISNEMKMKDGTVKWHLAESRKRLKNYFRLKINESA